MSWITIKRRKGLPKRLRKQLESIQHEPDNLKSIDISQTINQITHTINDPTFQKDNISGIINSKVYRDHTVSILIQLLPFFDQKTTNSIQNLLATTTREFPESSLPQYLIEHRDTLVLLIEYFDQPTVYVTSHYLVKTCTRSPQFVENLFEIGIVGSFVQYLSGDNFDKLSTAFSTYDAILNTHTDISARFLTANWHTYSIQFKQLLSSPNYLVQLSFLPVLFQFLTAQDCRRIIENYVCDVENLQLLMQLLLNNSKKIQFHAFSHFKLFVYFPRKPEQIRSLLTLNSSRLIRFLKEFTQDDGSQDFETEKQRVIEGIERLQKATEGFN